MSTKNLGSMICPDCKKACDEKDFIQNQTSCFRCSYAKKKLTDSILKEETLKCKICQKELLLDSNLKKRQRTIYCSDSCAKQGRTEMNSNHWTRKLLRNYKSNSTFYS